MSHSNSSLNCFAACAAKYEHNYILHTPPCKPPSPHLGFGAMAHEVLYKAGVLRDEVDDGVVDTEKYYPIIPSEVLYSEYKEFFGINNWYSYFTQVIKQVAKYEKDLVKEFTNGPIQIEREIKVQMTVEQLEHYGYTGIKQPIVGIIDMLIHDGTNAVIIDYKFSSSRKTQDDFDLNSQLPLYAFFVHHLYDIPLHNIKYGYIDIPKKSFDTPSLLKGGTLSRSKSQNVSSEMYEKAVTAIHGDDEYYNCAPGGYYYDVWCELQNNKAAYLSTQWLDMYVYANVIDDLMKTAKFVDGMVDLDLPFLRKYDSYTCKDCEYLKACKPWLTVNGGF